VNVGCLPFSIGTSKCRRAALFACRVRDALSTLLFLFNLNLVLHRLTAMCRMNPARRNPGVHNAEQFLLVLIPASLAIYLRWHK